MPTYVYRRSDGTRFEVFQRITAAPLTECPTTRQSVQRVISGGTGFILKGSGFYKTDYVSNGNGAAASKASEESEVKGDAAEPETKKATEEKATLEEDPA